MEQQTEQQTKAEQQEEVLEQGNTYAGEADVLDGTGEDEGSSKNKGISLSGKAGFFVIGAVILLVIIIGVVAISSRNAKKKAEEEAQQPADFLEDETLDFSYSDEEVAALRLAGYTGDEIEAFEFEERDSASLIEEAEAERQAQYDEEVAPYFDNASDEFKNLWNNTWVGQKELTFDKDVEQYNYSGEVMNVDYVKLPPRGHQLFIKFYLENGDACFMTVTPERYLTLKKKGNIVLDVEYTETGDGKRIITNITEVET